MFMSILPIAILFTWTKLPGRPISRVRFDVWAIKSLQFLDAWRDA